MNLESLIPLEHFNVASEITKHSSEKVALRWEDESGESQTITYDGLNRRANQLANSFTSLGLKKGDKVIVTTNRLIETYVIYLASLKAGLVISPASELLRAKDLVYRLNHSEAKVVICHALFVEEYEKIQEQTPFLKHRIAFGEEVPNWLSMAELTDGQPETFTDADTLRDDSAFLAYTSGTTSQPKGVVHTHGWGYAHIRIAAQYWLNIGQDDLVWATAAPGWQKWVWSPFLSILGSGATGFVYNGRFQPHKFLQLMQDQKVNVLCCTPTEYRMMAKYDDLGTFDLSSLHTGVSAGEALNREVIDIFKKECGILIRDGYGQTENTLLIANVNKDESKLGSMGQPLLPEFVDIIDKNGQPAPFNQVGTIAIRSDFPALFKQYYKNPEEMAASHCGDYFLTGDLAYKDEENYFWYQGRKDDLIISSGYTIGPVEVEDALMKHKSIQECAVVAAPDPIRGNIVKACVVLKDGISGTPALTKELQSFVKSLTAPYKYPRQIEYMEKLPKTESGKIRRVALRSK